MERWVGHLLFRLKIHYAIKAVSPCSWFIHRLRPQVAAEYFFQKRNSEKIFKPRLARYYLQMTPARKHFDFQPLTTLVVALLVFPAAAWADGSTFNVRQYGAVGDGMKMDTAALQQTIDAAANAGGGTVVLPPGKYLSGSIYLKSHVTLQLDEGATLLGSTHHKDYSKLYFHALLLADQQQDITVCGKGVIDGQGRELSAETERLFSEGKLPNANEGERPVLINFRKCSHVIVRDVTLKNSACWVQHYLDCDYLTLENITVRSNVAFNNDGIDVDGCTHTTVRHCDVDSEDDGICLKSGDRACDDVLVEDCRVRSTCNGLKFGTASVGGFKNVTCRNLEIYDTYISGIALEIVDGGLMENVNVSHVKITDTSNAIFIRLGHRNINGEIGKLHGVTISDVTAEIPDRPVGLLNKYPDEKHKYNSHTLVTSSITGQPGHPVQDVTIENVSIVFGGIGRVPQSNHLRWDNLAKVPESSNSYPECTRFGILPTWGFYCRHAEGIKFKNVTLRVQGHDYRPALVCDDVRNIELNGFHVESAGSEPVSRFQLTTKGWWTIIGFCRTWQPD